MCPAQILSILPQIHKAIKEEFSSQARLYKKNNEMQRKAAREIFPQQAVNPK
jgi:hypothetical protein